MPNNESMQAKPSSFWVWHWYTLLHPNSICEGNGGFITENKLWKQWMVLEIYLNFICTTCICANQPLYLVQLIDCLLTQLCNTPTALQHLSAFRDIDTDPLEFSQITTVFAENCPKRENIQQRAVSTVTVPPSCQRSEEKDQSAFRWWEGTGWLQ